MRHDVMLGTRRASKLKVKAWVALVFLAVVMGLLLFLPAGTVRYWQAWAFLGVFFGASSLITFYLIKNDPALLERRMSGGPTAEKRKAQKIIMFFVSIGFISLLVVSALDQRFGWSAVPASVVIAGNLLVGVGFYVIFLVYKENPFSSATVEVTEDQSVISSGPYAHVRHPHVRGRIALYGRHATGARLVLGPGGACSDEPFSNLAAL
jgi:protein-S-isoprenylcysteine O-methyltransferase Ste14